MGSKAARGRTGRLRVLQSPADQLNPFVRQLSAHLSDDFESRPFSWRDALGWRYDVLHLHWPERLVRAQGRRPAWVVRTLAALLLIRLAIRRTAVVQTLHNPAPHDSPDRIEAALLRRFESRTRARVALTKADGSSPGITVIPHGSYAGQYAIDSSAPATPGRMLYFGRIRPYKGVVEVIRELAASRARPDGLHLRVVGLPTEESVARDLAGAAVDGEAWLSLRLERVSDDDLVAEIEAAEAVILPYLGMGNSGALLLALTVGRPVLVPLTAVNAEVRADVGEDWVLMCPTPLDAASIIGGWTELTSPDARRRRASSAPDLSRRSWPDLAARYAEVYRDAIASGP